MSILQNPWLLFLAIILSLASTAFLWRAKKEKSASSLLYGIGVGLPTMGMTDWRWWAAGGGVTLAGWWLRSQFDV